METHRIAGEQIEDFRKHLHNEEHSPGTIEKYLRDMKNFRDFLSGRGATKALVLEWKELLIERNYAPATVNSMLAAVNSFFVFMRRSECKVRLLHVQRKMFRQESRELSKEEYKRLVETALADGRERLALLMETICATGIRVSEVRYITAEAARAGRADISLKGKIRTILIPGKLCRKLLKYAGNKKIASGEIFLTRSGRVISRKQIWAEMKALCKRAEVAISKVFPHNLRHLFAKAFYRATRDIAKLADILGHSSINTTRIYLIDTGVEHVLHLESLGLVN